MRLGTSSTSGVPIKFVVPIAAAFAILSQTSVDRTLLIRLTIIEYRCELRHSSIAFRQLRSSRRFNVARKLIFVCSFHPVIIIQRFISADCLKGASGSVKL
jgi:hypothetical protein